jgi:phospholipid/cholesterol/gamma-HCH transport system substrate-binding protein
MASKKQKIKLGIFMLLSAGTVLGLLVAFLGFEGPRASRYHVVTDDAAGLEVGSPVRLRGVRVGKVAELELVDTAPGVRIEIEVDHAVRINADARAYLEFAGLSGLKKLDIRGGTVSAPRLPPGSQIELGQTTLEKLSNQGEALVARASKLLGTADQLLANLNETTRRVKPEQVEDTWKDTQKLVRDLSRTAAQMNRLMEETREPLRQTVAAARTTFEQADELARRSDAVLEDLDATIGQLRGVVRENDTDVRAVIGNLREATRGFKTLSRDLRKRPNLLLFSGTPPERKLPE